MLIATKIHILERTGYRRRMMRGLRDGRELFWVVRTKTTREPGADIISVPQMTAAYDNKSGRFLRDRDGYPVQLCRMIIRHGQFSTESYPDRRARAIQDEQAAPRPRPAVSSKGRAPRKTKVASEAVAS